MDRWRCALNGIQMQKLIYEPCREIPIFNGKTTEED